MKLIIIVTDPNQDYWVSHFERIFDGIPKLRDAGNVYGQCEVIREAAKPYASCAFGSV
jgi:hypothetical protein